MSKKIFSSPISECVACGNNNIYLWSQKKFSNSLKKNIETFNIFRCRYCGSAFLNPPPTDDFLREIYAYSGHGLTEPVSFEKIIASEKDFPNSTVDATRLAETAKRLSRAQGNRALDIGSGFGFFTAALRKAGFDTVSINPGQYENMVFQKMNGDMPFIGYFQEFETDKLFSAILMSQVLEHLVDPTTAIKKASSLLERGGVFACAVPNFHSFMVSILGIKDNSCLWVPEHVNYFTVSGLKRLFARSGLKVIATNQISRIRHDAISRRFQIGKVKWLADFAVKYGQIPILSVANALGRGIYINVYGIKNK